MLKNFYRNIVPHCFNNPLAVPILSRSQPQESNFMKSKLPFYQFAGPLLFMVAIGIVDHTAMAQSVSPPKKPTAQLLKSKEAELDLVKSQVLTQQQFTESLRQEISSLTAQRNELLELQIEAGVSPESFPEIMRKLQTQRVDLIIELAGLKARRTAMIEFPQSTENPADKTIELLEQLLAQNLKKQARCEEMFSQGLIPEGEVMKAEGDVLNAEVELARAKQSTGNSQLAAELLTLSLDTAEKQARLDQTLLMLKSITETRQSVAEGEAVKEKLRLLKPNLESAENLLKQILAEAATRGKELQQEIKKLKLELEAGN